MEQNYPFEVPVTSQYSFAQNLKALIACVCFLFMIQVGGAQIEVDENNDVTIGEVAANGTKLVVDGDVEITSSNALTVSKIDAVEGGFTLFIGDNNVLAIASNGQFTPKYMNSADRNIVMGYDSGNANFSGIQNLIIGEQAGGNHQFGSNNIYFGEKAGLGKLNPTSSNVAFERSHNLCLGQSSGFKLSSGSFNTFLGKWSGLNTSVGTNNNFFGEKSGLSNTTGSHNIFLGELSGEKNISGMHNLCIGYKSGGNNSTGSNNICLGNLSIIKSGDSNAVAIGNESISYSGGVALGHKSTAFVNSISLGANSKASANGIAIGTGVIAAGNEIVIGNSIQCIVGTTCNPSDARFKENVESNVPGLEFITALRPVTYNFNYNELDRFKSGINSEASNSSQTYSINEEAYNIQRTGFLAQEVEQACKEINFDFDGIKTPVGENGTYSLSYAGFVVPLVQAVQEQQDQIEELEVTNRMLIQKLDAVLQKIEVLEAKAK